VGEQFRRCSVRFMLRLPSLQASWATNLDARALGCRDLYIRAFASRVTSSKRRTTLPGQVGQFPGSDSHRLGVWVYGLHVG